MGGEGFEYGIGGLVEGVWCRCRWRANELLVTTDELNLCTAGPDTPF